MERGDFDDLPGAGKPIPDLGESHDPNWWLKKLVEREHVAVLPPSLALRKEDAELDETLDRLTVETEVRRHVEDFNERVVAARYRLPEGPPLVTMPRDVDETVAPGASARTARLAEQRRKAREAVAEQASRAAAEASVVAAVPAVGRFTGYPVKLALPRRNFIREGPVSPGTR